MSEKIVIKDMNDALVHGYDILRNTDTAWTRGARKTAPTWRDNAITAKELQNRTYPPVRYIIPGLIPEGLSLLVGRPKIGKSWMALDIALSVASGATCLGGRTPDQGDVLYCALEDNERRLKNRITRLLANSKWPERLTLVTKWNRLNQGGVHDLKEWINETKQPRLILLDTLANVRPVSTQEGYAQDYAALTEIHRLANDKGIGIIALHHQRKVDADDPLDTISGTLGIAGCVDTPIILTSTSKGKSLYLRGRDVEEADYAVEFDSESCKWRLLGSAAEINLSETRRKIRDALKVSGSELGPQEIAQATGIAEGTVKVRLGDMVNDGEVLKRGRGRYIHPECV